MSQLRIDKIEKSFSKRKVVKGVSFTVEPGQVVGLMGPNGAGKTTSFYMVVGLLTPDSGDIFLEDKSIIHLPMYKRAKKGLSYLPQEPSIFRKLTVEQNILVALEAHGMRGRKKNERLENLINEFQIDHIRKNKGFSLSGGERRRVEIARALAGEPKILLLDEPFAGIDPIAVGDIQAMIRNLKNKGIGVLITDHNVRETLGICDFGYILRDGVVEVSGTPDLIINSKKAREFYLGENFNLS